VQGEGGFVVPPPQFLRGVKAVCERHKILFIVDEIQTGFGRTGKFLASEHFGVVPDLVVLAKAIAAGLPLGAVVGRADIMDAPGVGGLGGTYGGNPVACAAALAVLDVFREERLLDRARHLGDVIQPALLRMADRYALVGEVRGLGPMAALELVVDRESREPAPTHADAVLKYCYEHGLIILKAGLYSNVIRILLPLVATDDEVNGGLGILDQALATVSPRPGR
jgi:4-aminobutyrate aminotransferase/(S)-3-amino-2-methylpropionate transaminase